MRVRLKVCCITTAEELALAVQAGADAVGLVSAMPSGPGVIREEVIAELSSCVPPGVSTFLLTSLQEGKGIIDQHRRCQTSTLQLCDWVEPEVRSQLRAELPGVKLVQVIHVVGREAIDQAAAAEATADALLLDSGRPTDPQRSLGGTGQTHNWQISKLIRERATKPVYLAGGLNHTNIAEAIGVVQPFGVDVCTGVRSQGRLDPRQLDAFIETLGKISCR